MAHFYAGYTIASLRALPASELMALVDYRNEFYGATDDDEEVTDGG